VLFVSPEGISAHLKAVPKMPCGPLKSPFEEPLTPPAASAAPVGFALPAKPQSPLYTRKGVGRSVCEQIRGDEANKIGWLFNYVIGHSVKAHSAKAYFRDLDMVDDACKHDLLAPPAA
jgi:hypothetical protein